MTTGAALNRNASIVIRAKNEEALLGRALAAVYSQTLRNFEVIVVDSGSTDRTLEIAREFPTQIIQIRPDDFTYGRALNIGCRQARGDFLVFLSAHAIPLTSEWLARLLRHFDDANVAGVWGGENCDLSPPPRSRTLRQNLSMFLDDVYFGFSNANGSVRKDLWQAYPFDETLPFSEDKEWAYRVLQSGHTLIYDGSACVFHHHRDPIKKIWRRSHLCHEAFTRFLEFPRVSRTDILRRTYWQMLTLWREANTSRYRVARLSSEFPKIVAAEVGRYTGLRAGQSRSRSLIPALKV